MEWSRPDNIHETRWKAFVQLLEWALTHDEILLSSDIQHVLSVTKSPAARYIHIIADMYPDRFIEIPHHTDGPGAPRKALASATGTASLKAPRPLNPLIERCTACNILFIHGESHICTDMAHQRREYMRSYMREYYKKHPEKLKQWAKNNKKAAAKNTAIRLWRKATAEGSYSVQEWLSLVAMYNYTCLACGQRKPLTADHIVPLAHGGADTIDNIQPLCRGCNSSKGNKTIDYRPQA